MSAGIPNKCLPRGCCSPTFVFCSRSFRGSAAQRDVAFAANRSSHGKGVTPRRDGGDGIRSSVPNRRSIFSGSVAPIGETWDEGKFPQEKLVELLHGLMKPFVEEWVSHSATMRLSAVESMKRDAIWDEVREFITKYGAELFHAKMLTLGNVRAILHNGIPWFLNFLAESQDPLRPSPLLEALDSGAIETDHVVHVLELIYTTVVDKFDRFLEYNTTTHSVRLRREVFLSARLPASGSGHTTATPGTSRR